MTIKNLRHISGMLSLVGVLAIGGRADAAFYVSTSIFSVTGATNVMSGGGVSTYSVGNAIITLTDYATTGNTLGAIPAEAVTLTGTFSTGATIQVNENIFVTNPSGSGLASTITFHEVANYTLSALGLINTSTNFDSSTIPQTVGGTTFTVTNAQATSLQFGQTLNNGAISAVVLPSAAVPEPASIAMLGLGMLGLGAMTFRRRSAR